MSEPEYIDPRNLRPGPIRHESLPPEVLDRAKAVHDIVGPYLGTTLEQFEINLMRDADPDGEVAVWCGITAAWLAYHEKYTGDEMLPDEEEKKLLEAARHPTDRHNAMVRVMCPPRGQRRNPPRPARRRVRTGPPSRLPRPSPWRSGPAAHQLQGRA
jgi:hypothetical protein